MKFIISRTSSWGNEKPCEEAYRKQIIRIDERGFSSPEEYNREVGLTNTWNEEGFNHKIVPANDICDHPHIYREFNKKVWIVDIDSLEDLLNFKEKYGDLIITDSFENRNMKEIEIYDDWRE